jgi:bifunctional non-homologous end joining protein LigD
MRPTSPAARSLATDMEPMYASVGHAIPSGSTWVFEPKYDGVRVLAHISPRGVRLVTRNGNDKARQFPEVALALATLAERRGRPFILDGEIVGLVSGEPARFQTLQGRMHLKGSADIALAASRAPAAIIAFDMLGDNGVDLTHLPWSERRMHLESLLAGLPTTKRERGADLVARHVRLSLTSRNGGAILRRAARQSWEGVIAKRTDARYTPGVRSEAWLKLKLDFEQEFVVGGFTAPRKSREDIGALLLGYFDSHGKLVYVGHMGGGFTRTGLKAMRKRLDRLVRKTSPFKTEPHTNEPATWVRPTVVVEVKFSEWTADGRLRQPIFLGVRDDKPAREVTHEGVSLQRGIET